MRAPARRELAVAAQRRAPQSPHPLLALQQGAGNQAVARQLARFAGPDAEEDVEQVMERLARGRQTLFAAMRAAKDEQERRRRTMALRAFDAPWLAKLRALGTDKRHPDPDVQDMVLAALQLEAIATAEGVLRDPANAASITKNAVGMNDDRLKVKYDWCGFFAVDKFIKSNLDRELKSGYFSVGDVYDSFGYVYGDRVKRWIHADGAWHELREYHKLRGAERQWLTADEMECRERLDIRPGDVALVDHSWGGRGDHIVMVHSFDPQTRVLHTIGGNDSGLQVDTRKGTHAPANARQGRLEDATGTGLRTYRKGDERVGMREYDLAHQPDITERDGKYDKVRIAAIGRPSIVDFENHRYEGGELPPATAPT